MIWSDFCNVELAIVPFAFYHSSIKQAVSVNIFLVFLDLFKKQNSSFTPTCFDSFLLQKCNM